MKYTTVLSPRWTDAAQSAIDCQVEFDAVGLVPFTAAPTDLEPHGREIFARLVAGDFGQVADYLPPAAPAAATEPEPAAPAA